MAQYSRLEVLGEVIRQGLIPLAYTPDGAMLEHKRKAVIALVMSHHASLPLGAQEREAHCSDQYKEWLEQYEQAVYDDENLSARAEGARELIRLFQTQAANLRGIR